MGWECCTWGPRVFSCPACTPEDNPEPQSSEIWPTLHLRLRLQAAAECWEGVRPHVCSQANWHRGQPRWCRGSGQRLLRATGHLPCLSPRRLPGLVGVQVMRHLLGWGREVPDWGPSPLSLGTLLDHSPQPPSPSVASDPPSPWDLSTCHRPGPLLATSPVAGAPPTEAGGQSSLQQPPPSQGR